MENITMANTMKAAVVTEFNQPLQIQEVEIPKISSGKVLVKMIATGVCHTDLHAMHGDWPVKPTLPFIPGHEGVGEVIELGEGIEHLKVGDIVGFHGFIQPVVIAIIVMQAGKRYVRNNKIQVIPSTEVLPNIVWQMAIMSG